MTTALQVSEANGSPTFSISRTAEVKQSDYLFTRYRSDRNLVELHQMEVPQSWLQIIGNGIGLALLLAAIILLGMK